MAVPVPGQIVDGYRFQGGDPNDRNSWEQTPYGQGANSAPDGSIIVRGPRGGMTVIPAPTMTGGQTLPQTADQGHAQGFARLMADAERGYGDARRAGYDPTSLRNGVAGWVEGVPIIDGLAPIIRDEASDRGHRAELQWADAQLKAMSGAASPEAEVRRNIRTYFPTPGQDLQSAEPDYRRARQTAFGAAQLRAGGSANDVRYSRSTQDHIEAERQRARANWMNAWQRRHPNLPGADRAFDQWWAERMRQGQQQPQARQPARTGAGRRRDFTDMSDEDVLRAAGVTP